jgi:hypothetical protein
MHALSRTGRFTFAAALVAALGFGVTSLWAQPGQTVQGSYCEHHSDPVQCAYCCASYGAGGSIVINGKCHCMFES